MDVAKRVFHLFDPELQVEVYVEDGAHVKPGDSCHECEGQNAEPFADRTSYA